MGELRKTGRSAWTRPSLRACARCSRAHAIGEHETEMTHSRACGRNRHARRSAYGRRRRRLARGERAWRHAHGRAVDGPSRQVSRSGRAGLRPRARAARALAAQVRPARALRHPAQRFWGDRQLHRDQCPRGRQARSASAAPRCARERRAVRACQWAHRGEPFHGRGGDGLARHLGRGRQPERGGQRARRRAFPRAHGFQGHGAAQRQGHRRGDRGGRRRSQRRHRRRTPPPITRACCAKTWRLHSIS